MQVTVGHEQRCVSFRLSMTTLGFFFSFDFSLGAAPQVYSPLFLNQAKLGSVADYRAFELVFYTKKIIQ